MSISLDEDAILSPPMKHFSTAFPKTKACFGLKLLAPMMLILNCICPPEQSQPILLLWISRAPPNFLHRPWSSVHPTVSDTHCRLHQDWDTPQWRVLLFSFKIFTYPSFKIPSTVNIILPPPCLTVTVFLGLVASPFFLQTQAVPLWSNALFFSHLTKACFSSMQYLPPGHP